MPCVFFQDAVTIKNRQRFRPKSPGKESRVRRALTLVRGGKHSIREAALQCELKYMYVYRRHSRQVGIDSRSGRAPVFNATEEEAIARWLCTMATRGMGLKPGEFLDFIKGVVDREGRPTPFTDGRPGYAWYRSFMARNACTVGMRREVLLEFSRARLLPEDMDTWYRNYREFLITVDLLDKPDRIWNADECGFAMGSKAGQVIGPVNCQCTFQIAHVSGSDSKERPTAMYSANAAGQTMTVFLVYPRPAPAGCNPLNGALPGTTVEYTKKGGWMLVLGIGFCFMFDD